MSEAERDLAERDRELLRVYAEGHDESPTAALARAVLEVVDEIGVIKSARFPVQPSAPPDEEGVRIEGEEYEALRYAVKRAVEGAPKPQWRAEQAALLAKLPEGGSLTVHEPGAPIPPDDGLRVELRAIAEEIAVMTLMASLRTVSVPVAKLRAWTSIIAKAAGWNPSAEVAGPREHSDEGGEAASDADASRPVSDVNSVGGGLARRDRSTPRRS